MTLRVTVTHDEPGAAKPLEVTKVAVGKTDDAGEKHMLWPGELLTLSITQGVFLIVDESTEAAKVTT